MNIELENAAAENNVIAMMACYKDNDKLANAMAMAGQDGHKEAMIFLLSQETTPEDKKEGLAEALFYASQNGLVAMVDFLLENGAPFIRKGRSALHAAAGQGHSEIVQKLIAAGMNVAVTSRDNNTPLFEAVSNKKPEVVKILLAHGADPLHKDDFSLTPEALALRGGNQEIIGLLQKAIK